MWIYIGLGSQQDVGKIEQLKISFTQVTGRDVEDIYLEIGCTQRRNIWEQYVHIGWYGV